MARLIDANAPRPNPIDEDKRKIEFAINRLMCGNTAHSWRAGYIKDAINALQKLVPTKTITIEWDGDMLDEHCGVCEYNLKGQERYWNFCPCCGQKIDWRKCDEQTD